ncbi:hypothetical protein BGZ60DRAFT_425201 [Tricladium varicosporioides]|nr:hypothetical protein BGZ60DRAFT_425201 [Hymenoscyphus varicosporioides]
MPPVRTMPPAKAIKTERTHEENQERAYIAASRRSDRSLEARVESARRASEIHKRRTGRSLKVTEQDVINEEMYEEEDDDLPAQYRRLTAHLQTGSADFNRRLSAYLTNHVAMRSAVEQAITNSYAQEYSMSQYGNSTMFPSPMLTHQGQQQMMQQPQSPTTYRQAPYPAPRPQQQQQVRPISQGHHRSASIAIPNAGNVQRSPIVPPNNDRRMSMPTVRTSSDSPVETQLPLSATTIKQRPSFPPGSFAQNNLQQQNQFSMPQYNMGSRNNANYGPLSTALPAESQMLLGSTLDPNDPLTNMMMAGSDYLMGNFYNFDAQLPGTISIDKQQTHPSFDGLNSTLAPSALDLSQPTPDFNNFFDDATKPGSNDQTPAGTPGLGGDWGGLVDYDAWNFSSASQQSQASQ